MENDKIIIFTEDERKDPRIIKGILEKHFELVELDLHYSRDDKMENFADIIIEKPECTIFIKYIENVAFTFLNNFICDGYDDGLSLSNFYLGPLEFEFSQEFLCIDLDISDYVDKNFRNKHDFLCKADDIVSNMENTYLLISSPMTESIIDKNEVYYGKSSKYKQHISNTYSSEQNKIIPNYKKYVLMNNNKFKNVEIDMYNKHILSHYDKIKPNIPIYHQIGKLISEIEL